MFVPKVLTESGLKVAGEVSRRISLGRGSQGVKQLHTKLSVLMFLNGMYQISLTWKKMLHFPFQNYLGAIKKHTRTFS